MRRRSVGDQDMITKVNVTPIIDVALVLVIILLVTAPMLSVADLPVDLPQARTREAEDERNVSIRLASDVPYASLVPKRVEQRDCSRDHDSKRVVSGRPGKFSKAVALVAET